MKTYPLAVALITAACGGGDGGDPTPADPDAPPGQAIDAAEPDAEADETVDEYLRRVVAALTEGPRATVPQRNAAREWLLDELAAQGLDAELHGYETGANVIARLDGGDGPAIILGAHFDSVEAGPGAADNATGTAMVLALGRALRDLPSRDQPVILALFDQEEVGLVGSNRYALDLVADDVAVDAVHNYDMISFDGDRDGTVELWSPSPGLEDAYRAAAEPLGIPISAVDFEYSDHQSFLEQGFAAVGVCEEFVGDDHTPHYHQPTDTYDKIDFAYLRAVFDLALAVHTAEL